MEHVAAKRPGRPRDPGLADRRREDYLAMLAHELRNPLAPIRTGLHILARYDTRKMEIDLANGLNRVSLSNAIGKSFFRLKKP